ncbi:MAG TPA: phosphoribosylanthranilate isomerase [Longimicrobiales bacterium]|nr:phosphoribosylanthranilate isomerase [Longimicrobiales bacterium]
MIGVKICGVCRPEDAALAAECGATHVGVILTPGFRRSQNLATAQTIFEAAGAALRVGVFVNADLSAVLRAQRDLELDVLQFHGDEPIGLLRSARTVARVWKVIRVREPTEVQRALDFYRQEITGLLLDSYSDSAGGGSGKSFAWSQLASTRNSWIPGKPKLILAGGLTPENVAEAIDLLKPDVVDVSSGVEARVGEKSPERLRAFVAAARGAVVPNIS